MRIVIIVALFLCILHTASAQLILDPSSGKLKMEGVIPIDSVHGDHIFNRTMDWLMLRYHDLNKILYADFVSGKIVMKGIFPMKNSGNIDYTLILDVRDGRMRYRYTNFGVLNGAGIANLEEALPMKATIIRNTEEAIHQTLELIRSNALQHDPQW